MPGQMSNGKPKPGGKKKGDKPFMSTKEYERYLAKIITSGEVGKKKSKGKGRGR